jgi:ATP-dependent Lhr-like helicase
LQWQGLTDKGEGPEALATVIRQLEGFPVAAGAWETSVIPARINRYTSDMLDTLCGSGRLTWMRLRVATLSGDKKLPPLPSAPMSLIERQHLTIWRQLSPLNDSEQHHLSGNAEIVLALLRERGAMFFTDLVQQTDLLKTTVETVLGELVNWGLVTSDNFSGLRALIKPQRRRPRSLSRRRTYSMNSTFDNAGRWSELSTTEQVEDNQQSIEFLAHLFLRRYGVVFRILLEREPIVPPWRDLLRVYWRMEARGEIRGGRFVAGVSGEQFAQPDAVATLKCTRTAKADGELLVISATDPLNLAGILLPGDKIPATHNNRIVCRDGIPIMLQSGKQTRYLTELDPETIRQAEQLLSLQHRTIDFKKKAVVARFPRV